MVILRNNMISDIWNVLNIVYLTTTIIVCQMYSWFMQYCVSSSFTHSSMVSRVINKCLHYCYFAIFYHMDWFLPSFSFHMINLQALVNDILIALLLLCKVTQQRERHLGCDISLNIKGCCSSICNKYKTYLSFLAIVNNITFGVFSYVWSYACLKISPRRCKKDLYAFKLYLYLCFLTKLTWHVTFRKFER